MKKFFSAFLFVFLCAVLPGYPFKAYAVQNEITDPANITSAPFNTLMGDADGNDSVGSSDARMILRSAAKIDSIPIDRLVFADVNTDGKINSGDARTALRIAARLDTPIYHMLSVTVEIQPRCDSPGKLKYTCSECGISQPLDIPAAGHVWSEAIIERAQYCTVCGILHTGWTYAEGKWIFFQPDGSVTLGEVMQTEKLPDGSGGIRYTVNGVFDPAFRGAVSVYVEHLIVIAGIAEKVETAADITLFRAFSLLQEITAEDMTDEEKLSSCFDYVRDAFAEKRPRSPHYYGMDWPIVYANDIFENGYGNCFSFASAFAYLAKAIGYEKVYCCNSGEHGWVEIDGLIYDPEQSKNHDDYTYFGMAPDFHAKTDYASALSGAENWMRIKI